MAGASSEQRLIVRRLFLTGISYLRSPPGAARPHRTCCKVSARLLANMDCAMRFCAALLCCAQTPKFNSAALPPVAVVLTVSVRSLANRPR